MSEFTRAMPGYRLVTTRIDDDLQAVAGRELGDANRWPELVWMNGLTPPYITTKPQQVSSTVLLAGAFIKIPAPGGFGPEVPDRANSFERDCALNKRLLSDDGSGDLATFTGADNLRQALMHRIVTPRGQARRHPEYGCLIWRLVGTVNGPTAGIMGAQYVKSTIAADYRVSQVDYAIAEVIGDIVNVTAKATAIDGAVVDITTAKG